MTSLPLLKKILPLLIVLCIFLPGAAPGHQEIVSRDIGISEKTGDRIPPDLVFRDENGAYVNLRDIIRKPTILTLVYLTCDRICPQTLGGLAVAMGNIKMTPGIDYQLITISFDEGDDPAIAREKKINYVKAAGRNFSQDAWKFLTGDRKSVKGITDAVGFHFQQESHGFVHPVVLIFLSPEGKITGYDYLSKYQYGVEYPIIFSPAELMVELANAARGTVSSSLKKQVLYCFTHQPANQDRFFRILSVAGVVTLLSVVGFFIYLRASSRKRDSAGGKAHGE
jgi:protein SCO1/2